MSSLTPIKCFASASVFVGLLHSPFVSGETTHLPTQLSAHRMLQLKDLVAFRKGRSSSEILKDLDWRGNFEMACLLPEGSIAAISYELLARDGKPDHGEVIWAIFRDDKLEKLVPWPAWEMESVDYNGVPASRPKQMEVGDFDRLLDAAHSEGIDANVLMKRVKEGDSSPSQVDPGLTVTWLLLHAGLPAASKEDFAKNAALRNQFNASRLAVGMERERVKEILRSAPLHTGKLAQGSYEIFGSAQTFPLNSSLHFSNILVLLRDGKVAGIYSGETVEGGIEWRQKLREIFNRIN